MRTILNKLTKRRHHLKSRPGLHVSFCVCSVTRSPPFCVTSQPPFSPCHAGGRCGGLACGGSVCPAEWLVAPCGRGGGASRSARPVGGTCAAQGGTATPPYTPTQAQRQHPACDSKATASASTACAGCSCSGGAIAPCRDGDGHTPATRSTRGCARVGCSACTTSPAPHPTARQQRRLPQQQATGVSVHVPPIG